MTDLFLSAALLAADTGPGRGDNPDGASGVLIIAGIVLAVAIGAFVLHALFHRFGRTRREALTRTPARPGRVGRISEFRGR
jgi:hypothetical protein